MNDLLTKSENKLIPDGYQNPLRPLFWVAAFLASFTLFQPALALDPLGRVADVDPDASSEIFGTVASVLDGADLYEGQTISTGTSGQVQIIFTDQTKMVVGPNSQLLLERYLLRNDNSVASFAVNALGGTFRFITGDSDKDAYEINTPSGTIGVRGTAFDLFVDPLEQFGLVWLLDGAVRMCTEANSCIDLVQRCELGIIAPATGASLYEPVSGQFNVTDEAFPYEKSQRSLRADFRVFGARLCGLARHFERAPTVDAGLVTGTIQNIDIVLPGAIPEIPPPLDPGETAEDEIVVEPSSSKGNKGLGNGGEQDDNGSTTETQNPGNGNNGNGNGNPNK